MGWILVAIVLGPILLALWGAELWCTLEDKLSDD